MEERKKILFIYPPSPVMNREDRCQQPTKDLLVIPPLPPMDLMYMAAVAESVGLEAKIVDYSLEEDAKRQRCKDAKIKENVIASDSEAIQNHPSPFTSHLSLFKPDYLVVNVASTTLENDLSSLA